MPVDIRVLLHISVPVRISILTRLTSCLRLLFSDALIYAFSSLYGSFVDCFTGRVLNNWGKMFKIFFCSNEITCEYIFFSWIPGLVISRIQCGLLLLSS